MNVLGNLKGLGDVIEQAKPQYQKTKPTSCSSLPTDSEAEPASSKHQASSYPLVFTLFTGLAVK